MRHEPGDPPESEFEYKGRSARVYAVNIENAPGFYTFQVSIDGTVRPTGNPPLRVPQADAIGAGNEFARKVIDSESSQ